MKVIKIFATIAVLALICSGCAKPPTAEMNSAVEAVTRAENDADAVLYAANSIARAKDALARMQAEADSKRYDAAKTYAAEAVAAAEKALADGRSGALRARNEAETLVAALRPTIAETDNGLQAARSAGLAVDFDALNRDFDAARQNVAQAESALSGNRYEDALNSGRSAQSGISDINQRLSDAVMAVSRKK
jgi:PBP1b-binding outer membrane lipoprotein LpoB